MGAKAVFCFQAKTTCKMELDFKDAGPKTWGLLFFLIFLLASYVFKRLAGCCLSSQRSKLRDDYENELRRGGHLTNILLLPSACQTKRTPY